MRKDNFDILARTTDLLTEIKTTDDYKQADKKLVDFLEKQIKRSRTISELLEIWSDGCKGLEVLRLRYSKLKFEIAGGMTADQAMLIALETGTVRDNHTTGLVSLDISMSVFEFVSETYSKEYSITDADKLALACIVLLDYLYSRDYDGLNYYETIKIAVDSAYREEILNEVEPPIMGLREKIWDFKFEDRQFVGVFASGLKDLLVEDKSVLGLELKGLVNDSLMAAWTGITWATVFDVYSELEKVLITDKTEVSAKVVHDWIYIKDFAVKREYCKDRIYYRLDMEALEVLAGMIKDLGLEQLDENKLILDLIARR